MKLTFNQIQEITQGAARMIKSEGGYCFYRFTEEQENLYKERNLDFYNKTFSTSGIKFKFKTDSENIFLSVNISKSSSRTYFSFDIFVNGKMIDSLSNFDALQMPINYTTAAFPLGEFSKQIYLGEGEKEVCIYFPWSVCAQVEEISVDDGAIVEKLESKKKLLAFGDSITHGYDALHPSNKYVTKLAAYLNAEEINKAIGGEIFFPKLAETKENFVPDYITVAYGTNDWNNITKSEFEVNCRKFYESLNNNYPEAEIFAVTPIWRKDMNEQRKFGGFETVEEIIKELTADFKNVTLISGYDLVPNCEEYFADLRLHPNDEGFDFYFKNLADKL